MDSGYQRVGPEIGGAAIQGALPQGALERSPEVGIGDEPGVVLAQVVRETGLPGLVDAARAGEVVLDREIEHQIRIELVAVIAQEVELVAVVSARERDRAAHDGRLASAAHPGQALFQTRCQHL